MYLLQHFSMLHSSWLCQKWTSSWCKWEIFDGELSTKLTNGKNVHTNPQHLSKNSEPSVYDLLFIADLKIQTDQKQRTSEYMITLKLHRSSLTKRKSSVPVEQLLQWSHFESRKPEKTISLTVHYFLPNRWRQKEFERFHSHKQFVSSENCESNRKAFQNH